jgi:hypothetical protein
MSGVAADLAGRPPIAVRDTRAEARQGLKIYFGVVIVVSALIEGWIITHGGLGGKFGWLVLPLMYTPTLGCLTARLVRHEGFGDVSFRWGGITGTRATLTALFFPVAIGLVAYGLSWLTGLTTFGAPEAGRLTNIANPSLRFVAMLGFALTIGTVMSCISAFGEELGWRGYMVPRLVQAEIPRADVISGFVWCFWHVPLILWGGYAVSAYPLLSAALFVASIMPVALLYFRWRMASGSVWPCVIAHGAWNVVIQGVFDPFTHGTNAAIWTGESGVLTAVTVWCAYWLIRNKVWAGTHASVARA